MLTNILGFKFRNTLPTFCNPIHESGRGLLPTQGAFKSGGASGQLRGDSKDNSGGPQAPLPILANPCAERWLVPSREWIPSTDSREEFKQDIPRIYHSKNELEAHHPGPYKEFDFSVFSIRMCKSSLNLLPVSNNQRSQSQRIFLDLAMRQCHKNMNVARPMQVEPSQTPNVLGEGRQSAMELPVPSRAGPSNRHQVPKSLVMYRFPDFAVEDEGFFREVHGGWACKYPACMKRWGLEARRDNMLAHWVTHSEDTPFACNVEEFHPPAYGQEPCSRIHKRLNELKKHVQNDHNVQVWQKGFSRTQTFAEMDLDDTRLRTQGRQR
ncbi:hypothetical protein H4Q26_017622, partial [Puccinia striiformis f. sp. tritici PST-130]